MIGKRIDCPFCGSEIIHPHDVEVRYCERCGRYHDIVETMTVDFLLGEPIDDWERRIDREKDTKAT